MAVDFVFVQLFDAFLKNSFKDITVTLDTYSDLFEKNFNKVFEEIKMLNRFALYVNQLENSPKDLKEFKDDFFKKYTSLCSYQTDKVYAIEDPEHKEWLKDKYNSIQWNQWNAYAEYLKNKKCFSRKSIDSIGQLADRIIDRFEDPTLDNNIKVKGLLMGEVQSGKTCFFMATIHKAVDVGWRFIIVLAGLTDDLRFQTQERINEDFIGYTLSRESYYQNCGIRKLFNKYDYFHFEPITTLDKDFSKDQGSKILSKHNSVYVAVCKKNSRILNNLLEWLGGNPDNPDKNSDRREIAQNIPCLIIDDEADHASLNTKKEIDEYTAVNGAIRNLLKYFRKSAYLAVTATPYANLFINPQVLESDQIYQLPDLFPNNFIFVKLTPKGYTGVNELFGKDDNDPDCQSGQLEDQVIIPIENNVEEIFNNSLAKDASIDKLPPSLILALRYFFCCCVFKELTIDSHVSMLVNIDYRKSNHKSISDLIEDFWKAECNAIRLAQGLDKSELLSDERYLAYKKIWEEGCISNEFECSSNYTFEYLSKTEFDNIWKHSLFSAMEKIRLETINSDYRGDKLANIYKTYKNLKIILVGGYSLSRGVTIEGLCVSYLTRRTSAVDTLVQMGRFFGYRGYDTRIMKVWLTDVIKDMFKESCCAQKEFIEQVNIMNDHDQTPSTFGFKIHQAPAYLKLRIAARNKMHHSTNLTLDVNIAGQVLQSSKLPFDKDLLIKNKEIVAEFLSELNSNNVMKVSPDVTDYPDAYWDNVDSFQISKLVSEFNAIGWGEIMRADIAEYISKKLSDFKWTVTVLSNYRTLHDKLDLFNLGRKFVAIPSKVYLKRDDKKYIYFSSGSLMRGSDLSRRLSSEQISILKRDYPKDKELSNTAIARNKPRLNLNPQLIIYSVQPNFFKDPVFKKDYQDIICALGLAVPCTGDLERTRLKINYDVNDIYRYNLPDDYKY